MEQPAQGPAHPLLQSDDTVQHGSGEQQPEMASAFLSNIMDSSDPENPHNWPLHRKLFTSFACWCMAFGARALCRDGRQKDRAAGHGLSLNTTITHTNYMMLYCPF